MSTTPRPWMAPPPRDEHERPDRDDAMRAVNAFEALLAVAKAAETGIDTNDHCSICASYLDPATGATHTPTCPYGVLDAQHPGWREWSA